MNFVPSVPGFISNDLLRHSSAHDMVYSMQILGGPVSPGGGQNLTQFQASSLSQVQPRSYPWEALVSYPPKFTMGTAALLSSYPKSS